MEAIINKILLTIGCHFIGDYVLQGDYIAQTKGTNWYHMFIHCFLYCIPFCLCFDMSYIAMIVLFLTHFYIDTLKARYHTIGYASDQILHYIISFEITFFF